MVVIAVMVASIAIPMRQASAVLVPVPCASEPLFGGYMFVEDSLVLDDGSLLVAGLASDTQPPTTIFSFVGKFQPDGSLDPSFGVGGLVGIDLGASSQYAYGIALDDAGRIIVAGTAWLATDTVGFVVRMFPDGTPDDSFGTVGLSLLPAASVMDVAATHDGRLLLELNGDVAALDDTGAPDLTFGTNGRAGLANVLRVAVRPDGQMMAFAGGSSIHVTGLTPVGQIDASFGTAGATDVVITSDHQINDVAVAPDGTTVIAGGNRIDGATFHPFLLELQPSGLVDSSFDQSSPLYSTNSFATSAAIDATHHIVATTTQSAGGGSSVVRLLPGGAVDNAFGVNGVISGEGLAWSVRLRPDGAALVTVNQLQPMYTTVVFGFDATGACFDPGAGLPATSSAFVPLSAQRLLDTRIGLGRGGTNAVPANSSIDLQVTGHGGVPIDGVAAVVLNVTLTESGAPGYVTAWPTGELRPVASNLNAELAGQTVASLVTVPVGSTGAVSLYTQSGGHLIADVMGYYVLSGPTRDGRLEATDPHRVLDTRLGTGVGGVTTRPSAGQVLKLQISGVGQVVPPTASAVILNLTATDAAAPGFITVWSEGTRPTTSNLNVTYGGQTVANQVIVPIGADGSIELFTQSGTHLVADVVGWFTGIDDARSTSGLFIPTAPTRHIDTRQTKPLAPGDTVAVDAAGAHLVPATGVSAVVGTLTVTNSKGAGFFTAFPDGATRPTASNLNAEHADQTIANHITTKLANNRFDVFSQTGGDVIVDITGWYTS